ncbi:glycosyl transferase [Nocardioides mangrovicus]|uniref:Glycosyl transferase n=2 Tax=Nocardioides mangrovicus TaxID=2478913 RepID=A0A3L8NZN8_9ACTN|nr:glycosyl transferase [Nocardioides mangrovicus]
MADERLDATKVVSHVGVMIAVSVVLGLLVGGLAIPFAGALGIASTSAAKSLDDLPVQLQTSALPQRTRMLASNGQTIATFYDENRTNVSLDQIAPIMRTAIVSIEDYRFYQHGALDLKGTLRAFVTNSGSSGVVQGGSSITQQLAKLTLLQDSQTASERKAATADTYQRKIAELRHAIAFEQHHSKDWILNRYLNIAYFGDGAYGIQAASRHYFNVDAKNLNLRQAALLAGLVKNPVGYDPTNNPAAAKTRRDIVLDRMAQLHKITTEKAETVKKRPVGLNLTPSSNGCASSDYPFFCDYAYRYLLTDPSLGKTVEDRKELIYAGGLTIKTTIDPRYQKAADNAVSAHVKATDQAIGAVAMVEPGTGQVRAISQSRPMGRNGSLGQTYLNYVVPSSLGDSGGFQAGSTFKLFVLAAALGQGLSPYTSINSPAALKVALNSYETCSGPYTSSEDFTFHNSTDSGRMNMYTGMQLSVNTFFVQLEQRTGLCEPWTLAKKMGVNLTVKPTPAFTLGVNSVSPLEMAEAYATVAARGNHCKATPVTEILNSDNKEFKKYSSDCDQVMTQSTADRIADILKGVMTGRGFGAALAIDKESAGKTGTTQDNKAVWFDGFTPAIATVAMVAGANQQGTPITLNGQSVGGEIIGTAHGSTVAGPIWGDTMKAIQDLLPDESFVEPTNDYGSTQGFNNPTSATTGNGGQAQTQVAAPKPRKHRGHGDGHGPRPRH